MQPANRSAHQRNRDAAHNGERWREFEGGTSERSEAKQLQLSAACLSSPPQAARAAQPMLPRSFDERGSSNSSTLIDDRP